jgi:beta-lactam-binding protein with PASTA domain
MPTRIFAITAARETVTLDNQGRAEVSFTASNTGPKSIAGRAKLVPFGSTKATWLSLEGEQERNFAQGEAHQLTVHIAVPPGTAVGKYSFRLNIISVENPDDEFTEGPSVSFEVKELTVAQAPPHKFPWWIVAIAAVLLVGAGVITWLLIPQRVAMPNVVGKSLKDAEKSLGDAKLKPAKETKKKITGTQKPGTVIEQDPEKEKSVRVGSEVNLVVEGEPELVKVPDIIGVPAAKVGQILEDRRLRLRTEPKSGGEKPGTIVDQNPKKDEPVAPGTIITAFVQPEPEMVSVPNVIGLPVNEAEAKFQEKKLEYKANGEVITGKAKIGAIASQSPAAGDTVLVGTKVILTIEANSVEVPNVIGRTIAQAMNELNWRGLVADVKLGSTTQSMPPPQSKVVWQSPKDGTRVAPSTFVAVSAEPQ